MKKIKLPKSLYSDVYLRIFYSGKDLRKEASNRIKVQRLLVKQKRNRGTYLFYVFMKRVSDNVGKKSNKWDTMGLSLKKY